MIHDPTAILSQRTERVLGLSYKLGEGFSQYGLDTAFLDDAAVDEKRMCLTIPFADGNRRDGVGDLLEVQGIDTSRHRVNPLVLFDHGKQVQLPIAMAQDPDTGAYTVEIDPQARTAKLLAFFYRGKSLPDGQANKSQEYEHALFCEQLFDLAAKKFIRAGSIGYQVKHARPLRADYETGTQAGLHLLSVLMLEGSLVVLPANGDTVRKALDLPSICGKAPGLYLVKSLTPYLPGRKAVVTGSYESKAKVAGRGNKPNGKCECGASIPAGETECESCKYHRGDPGAEERAAAERRAERDVARGKAIQKPSYRTFTGDDVAVQGKLKPGDTVIARTYIGAGQGPPIAPWDTSRKGPAAKTGDRLEVLGWTESGSGLVTLRLRNKTTGIEFTTDPTNVRKSLGNHPTKSLGMSGTKAERPFLVPLSQVAGHWRVGNRYGQELRNSPHFTSKEDAQRWIDEHPEVVAQARSRPLGSKSLTAIRRKYRSPGLVRRRHRKSSPGVSTVHVREKDLAGLRDEA